MCNGNNWIGRVITAALALVLVLSLTGCGEKDSAENPARDVAERYITGQYKGNVDSGKQFLDALHPAAVDYLCARREMSREELEQELWENFAKAEITLTFQREQKLEDDSPFTAYLRQLYANEALKLNVTSVRDEVFHISTTVDGKKTPNQDLRVRVVEIGGVWYAHWTGLEPVLFN